MRKREGQLGLVEKQVAVDSGRGGVYVGGPVPLIKVEKLPNGRKKRGNRYDLMMRVYLLFKRW